MSVVLTPGVRRGLAVHTLVRTARAEGGEEITPPKPRPMLRASRGRLALKANVGLPCDNEREAIARSGVAGPRSGAEVDDR